jgi:hypothetical protein
MTDRQPAKAAHAKAPVKDPEFEQQAKVAEAILRRYRNAFRELAK